MANKKVSQLTSKPSVLVTDLFPIADPSTGQLYKTTISDLGTAIGSGVSSVNGLVGAVVLDTDDIQELVSPTNKWFTDTRARAAISAGTGISYNSGTGIITNAVTSGQIATALGYTPADDSLVVKLAGSQTITGVKTFDAIQRFNFGLSVKSVGGANQGIFGNDNGFNIGVNAYTHSLLFPNSGGYNYTLPATTGTIALTSDLSAYALDSAVVKLTGNQTVAGQKTFSSTIYGAGAVFSAAMVAQSLNITGITASPSVYITTNGTNHAVSIVQSGAGYAIYASGNVAVIGTGYFSSSLTAASLSSTAGYNYTLPSASGTLALTSNLSSYLPLSGGTLTGALTVSVNGSTFGTASASGRAIIVQSGSSDQAIMFKNAAGGDGTLFATGTSTTMNYSFSTYSTSNALFIANGGNIGIGTTSPYSISSGYKALTLDDTNGGGIAMRASGTLYGLIYAATNELYINSAGGSGTMLFYTAGSERMRITSSGFLKQSNNGSYGVGSLPVNEFCSDQNYATIRTQNSRTSGGEEMLRMVYSQWSPNNSSSWFIYANDLSAARFYVRSDGGIGNYQGNNVNLSDERTKKEISPLESYWNKFKALEIVKFKYKDQTHDDFNIGVIAQQVESVAPEFVDVDGWGDNQNDETPLKSIYTADLYHASIGVLKEAMAKIETLEAKIKTLENK
jgi:hypothetical protein